jgi:hypothetical protein
MKGFQMKKLVAGAVVAVALAVLSGCSDSVSAVKSGTMEAYPQGTIGDVFTANFDDGKWVAEKKDGKEYVTFTGKISKKLHDQEYAKVNDFTAFNRSSTSFSKDFQQQLAAFRDGNTELKNTIKELDSLDADLKAKDEAIRQQISDLGMQQGQVLTSNPKYRELEIQIYKLQQEEEANKGKRMEVWRSPRYSQLETKKTELTNALEQQEVEQKAKLCKELTHKYWWPVGAEVEFKWIVYPDGDKFEISSVASQSWGEYKMSITDVLDTLYGK